MHVLVAGCGWLGTAVAAALLERGDRVTGVRRDPGRAEALRPLGVEPLALDLADPAAADRIPHGVEAILALQAAGAGPEDYRRAYLQANATLLRAAQRLDLAALVYSGSTGVFGQRDGSQVDEATPPAPDSATARVLAEAERLLLGAAGIPVRIVRLSGLYGPARTGLIGRVRSGALALGPGDGAWMNFCHRDDAVAAILAALDRGRDGAVYHASDARPMRRREVVRLVAEGLGIPPPQAAGTPAVAGPDRRISGTRTRTELALELRWPTLGQGLADTFRSSGLAIE
ncbi:MAG: NAD-dependent epimerase/dehydratase family protein [Holophaga sp.]|nr:NAD-dependent epimerase/dehydratase family protein [Holophaga sp.]